MKRLPRLKYPKPSPFDTCNAGKIFKGYESLFTNKTEKSQQLADLKSLKESGFMSYQLNNPAIISFMDIKMCFLPMHCFVLK